jgi:hypothetical protein
MSILIAMPTDPFDPSVFTRAPIITVESGIALAKALVAACPKGMPENVKKACTKLKAAAAAAQAALADRQRELGKVTDEDVRLIDVEADTAWSALRMRLQAYASLPASRFARATRAEELLTILFGVDGLNFLKFSYAEQWSTMETILGRIDGDKLQKDIDGIAGPEFLKQIRASHAVYGPMVEAMLRRDTQGGVNLLEHIRGMGRTIVDYATKVCGTVDEDKPATIATARKALSPIESHRQAAARRAGASGATPEAATPEVSGPAKPE